jgi:hypothetical protein
MGLAWKISHHKDDVRLEIGVTSNSCFRDKLSTGSKQSLAERRTNKRRLGQQHGRVGEIESHLDAHTTQERHQREKTGLAAMGSETVSIGDAQDA